MDTYATPNYLYEIINKCTQTEFNQSSQNQIKTAHASLGLKSSNKKKDDLISDIYRFLANILVKQGSANQMRDGFPLFNHNNELFQRNEAVKHLVEACNQKIHIANIHLAQINYNRLNQVKKALNIPESQSVCICNQAIDANTTMEPLIKCINPKCGRLLHKSCMKLPPEEEDYPLFECPDCVLMKCDPLHEVIKILVQPYIVDNLPKEFKIDDMIYREVKTNESLGVEVRTIRLENKTHEHCWPHQGELDLNGYRCLEFKPLQHNSSLKKRKDERFFTTDINTGANHIKLKYVKGTDPRNPYADETYMTAVYLVRKLSTEDLVQRIKTENRRSIEECKNLIVEEFKNSSVDIDRVISPLTCVFDMQPLKTPAKGLHCKHPTCFSLENYINLWQKNNQRKWICPICKVKAYDLIVDSYFEKIVEELKKTDFENGTPDEVEILRNGDYKFLRNEVKAENDEEQKQRLEAKPEKSVDKSVNVIVLDDSDDEAAAKAKTPPAIKTTEVNTNNKQLVKPRSMSEDITKVSQEKVQAEGKKANSVVMEVEKEGEDGQEEGENSENKQLDNGVTINIEADHGDSKGIEEEVEEEDSQHALRNRDAEFADMTRPDKLHDEESEKMGSVNKSVDGDRMEEDKSSVKTKEKSQTKATKEKDQSESKRSVKSKNGQQQEAKNQQQQNIYDQYQQMQASEEYRLRQQQQQQYQQQQQKLQYLNEMLSLPTLNTALQNLQQTAMLANLLNSFGNNMNLLQQAASAFPGLLSNNMKPKFPQQAGRPSSEEIAALLMGDSPYKGNFGNDMGNPFNSLLRGVNDVNLLQALRLNSMNGLNGLGGLAAFNGLNALAGGLNGLNPSVLEALLQPQKNDVSIPNIRSGNSPITSLLSNPVKMPVNNQQIMENEEEETPIEENTTTWEVERKPDPVLNRDPNRKRVFKVEKEKPLDRINADIDKSLERLTEYAEIKLEIPKFENFKTMAFTESKKLKEMNLQKNKKLIALVMKQFPLPVKKPEKPVEEQEKQAGLQEMTSEQPNVKENDGQMETEDKEQEQKQAQEKEKEKEHAIEEEQPQNQQQQEPINVKAGQESDPICLE